VFNEVRYRSQLNKFTIHLSTYLYTTTCSSLFVLGFPDDVLNKVVWRPINVHISYFISCLRFNFASSFYLVPSHLGQAYTFNLQITQLRAPVYICHLCKYMKNTTAWGRRNIHTQSDNTQVYSYNFLSIYVDQLPADALGTLSCKPSNFKKRFRKVKKKRRSEGLGDINQKCSEVKWTVVRMRRMSKCSEVEWREGHSEMWVH
jgi:hypothetical protein